MISGAAKLAGVIGWPVKHSRSPALHGHWLAQYNIDGSYIPMEVSPADLAAVLRSLPQMGFAGVNLTLPHKEAALSLVDEVSATAKAIGAVNTIYIRKNGTLRGDNTDAYGFIENLKQSRVSLKGRRCLLLGAGGAAKAVAHGLKQEKVAGIKIVNRNRARADRLAHSLGSFGEAHEWDDREALLKECDLLVNATSLGMRGEPPLELSLRNLPMEAAVTDIVYTPLNTPLLTAAKRRGNIAVDGLGMLLHQAAPGFKAWFGVEPKVTTALREAVLK